MLRAVHLLFLLVAAGVVNVLLYADVWRHALPPRAPAPAADAETHPRLVVLGVDGVDHGWLRRYLEDDARREPAQRQLPNLAQVVERGSLHPLRSEIPPESPVAWASLMTGVNPAKHGITDFVRPGRDYRPLNGMVELRRMRLALGKIPVRPPIVRSRLAAPTFLERIHAAGYPVLGLRQPMLFPARPMPGARMLSGLGTPDIAGGAGFYAVWGSRVNFEEGPTIFGGVQIPLDPKETTRFETYLPGPPDPSLPRAAGNALARELLGGRDPTRVAIHLAGRTEVVAVGERSPFMIVPFELSTFPKITVRGHVRFEVKKLDPLVVLADPVNIYAPTSAFPLTAPASYATELFERYGPFETVGWSEQTFALNDDYQDDEGFLRDLEEDMDRGAGMLLGELDRGGRCVFQVFTATDRALHCFYRYYDQEHPAYVPGRVEALGDPMLRLYARLDRIVGDVLGRLGPEDVLLICSDHGFQTWRWEVNVNAWLVENGYMTLRGDVREQNLTNFCHGGDLSADAIDWSRTKAYAMGLGQIYLNRKGREEQGIVDDAEADALAREIREKLLPLRNPFRPDERPIKEIYLLHEVYDGPLRDAAAELQLGFDVGYRISWQTALLGGMGKPVFEQNTYAWSGDHCSTDVSVVEGILLVNRKVPPAPEGRPYQVRDIAATACAFFGVDTSELEGAPIPLEPSE